MEGEEEEKRKGRGQREGERERERKTSIPKEPYENLFTFLVSQRYLAKMIQTVVVIKAKESELWEIFLVESSSICFMLRPACSCSLFPVSFQCSLW